MSEIVRLKAFLIVVAFLLFPGAAWALGPHGPYFGNPDACGACHVAHVAYSEPLIQKPSQTQICLVCHDGTGSIYNVYNAVYGFGPLSGSTHFHPVANTGNPAVGSVIECAYCHNPHGSSAKLLWDFWDRTTAASGVYGPGFCLICHGSADRGFPSVEDPAVSYWVYTLGDHSNGPHAAHYQEVDPLLPASGTRVTCVSCHRQHASDSVRFLVYGGGVPLCTQCHVTAGSGSVHAVTAFSRTGSVHDVYGISDSYDAGLLCTSCHGPHTVASFTYVPCSDCHYPGVQKNAYKLSGSYSVLSDPDNTKLSFTGAAGNTSLGGAANSTGDLSDFCLRCHDNDPPVATATYTVYVPSTISFTGLPAVTTNSGGWVNKANYKTSAHGSETTVITCGECHESHGSNYKYLQRYPEDDTLTDGECLRCHNGLNATWPSAPDVKSDFLSAYRHPTLTTSGVHSNTEDYAGVTRHAECADCHDAHQATAGDPLRGVSGVVPQYGTTAWTTPDSYGFTSEATYEYQICLKCHSYFSYGSAPPVSPSGGFAETDQSVEFNPNNQGYHAVIGSSKVPQFQDSLGNYHYYGSYVAPWEGNSVLTCSDCHSGSRRGPHGSSNAFILKDSGDSLCAGCHDQAFYATYAQTPTGDPATDGSDSLRSGWSNPSLTVEEATYTYNGITATASVYNFHPVHANLGCNSCHSAIPHGWNARRSLLVTTGDDYPYNDGARLWSSFTLPASREQWYCTNCHS